MVKFVLSWWGDYTDSVKIDALYKWMLGGKRILYIPRAMRPGAYPSCLEWIQNTFPANDWYDVHLLSEQEFVDNNEDYLASYDGIYIWGGNTYRLLSLLRKTWFWKIIKDFIDNNKPIYWWSAWAIIMGKEIHTSPDMNATKLSFEETLWYDICNGCSLVCHHHERKNDEIKDYTLNYQIPVICLPEWTAVMSNENICTIEWEKMAYMIDTNGNIKNLPIWSKI